MKKKYKVTGIGLSEHRHINVNDIIELEELPEESEEKSLEDKFDVEVHGVIKDQNNVPIFWSMRKSPKGLAKIAREHFKEHSEEIGCTDISNVEVLTCECKRLKAGMVSKEAVLRVFDEVYQAWNNDGCVTLGDLIYRLRKALSEM